MHSQVRNHVRPHRLVLGVVRMRRHRVKRLSRRISSERGGRNVPIKEPVQFSWPQSRSTPRMIDHCLIAPNTTTEKDSQYLFYFPLLTVFS
jgi:hypothetical protein